MPPFALTVLKVIFLGLLYFFIWRSFRSVVGGLRPAQPARGGRDRPGRGARPARANGKPPRELVLLDERGNRLPDGEAGLLGVRTPSLTPGYWDDPTLGRESLSNGYFLTGDVVRREADGLWYHLDRTPDVIHTAEGPVHSLPLEEAVLLETQALDAAVVAVDDPEHSGSSRPAAVLLFRGECPASPAALLNRCNAALEKDGLAPLSALVIADGRGGLPVGPTGKVLKRRLRDEHRDILRRTAGADTAHERPASYPEPAG